MVPINNIEAPPRIQGLASGARTGLIGAIGGRFLNVLGNVIVARLFGPTLFGIYAIGWTLMRFLSLIVPLGMDRAVLRFGPGYWQKDWPGFSELLKKVILYALASGIIFGACFYFSAPWLASNVYRQSQLVTLFRYFSFAFPPLAILTVIAAATRITRLIKYSVWLYDIGQPLLGLLLILAFYVFHQGITGMVLAEIISLTLAALLGLVLIKVIFPNVTFRTSSSDISARKILDYSMPAMLGGAFTVYILWMDRIFVGLLMPPVENGIFVAVSQISTVIMVILAGISPIAVPLFSHFHHNHETKQLEEVYRISTKWGIYLSLPILAVLLISPGDSLELIFGELFRSGADILVVLLIGQTINILTGSVNPLMIMTENQKVLFRISAVMLLADILMLLLLIPKFGIIGAAISTSACVGLLNLFELLWVKIKLGLWPYDRRYFKGFLAGAACFGAVALVKVFINTNPVIEVIVQAVVAISVFFVMLLLLKIEPEDREFLMSFKQKISNQGEGINP